MPVWHRAWAPRGCAMRPLGMASLGSVAEVYHLLTNFSTEGAWKTSKQCL